MLLDAQAETRIKGILDATGGAIATYLIGRDLGQSYPQALSSALAIRRLTSLEQSYLAGKAASLIGPDQLKGLTLEETQTWLQANPVTLTDREKAQLKALRDDTAKWIEGRTADWKKTFNQALAAADRGWRAEIAKGNVLDAQARTTARNAALQELSSVMRGEASSFKEQTNRLLQTEMHRYFQEGQTSTWSGETFVYKLPQPGACNHCLRLHLNSDGSPKLHRLADVAGNSNIGAASYDWAFTIGPTHPHCYCTLYSTEQSPDPGPSQERAEQRAQALKRPKPSEEPEALKKMRKAAEQGGELPQHVLVLMDALRKTYEEGSE